MSTVNKVQLTGNAGSGPEIKTFESGSRMARFTMATHEEYTSKSGEKTKDTQWHNITAWGKIVDVIEAEVKKGTFLSVEGRLTTRNYTDKNGNKKYITEVVANDVIIKQKES